MRHYTMFLFEIDALLFKEKLLINKKVVNVLTRINEFNMIEISWIT